LFLDGDNQIVSTSNLADASIWLFQFLKVMRDEQGDFIPNGHLLGFFRRICSLLFNRIRPVFVFDGATPILKRLTVAARRHRRETQHAQVHLSSKMLQRVRSLAQKNR
jgi:DNA excision repair protein ERCC-5